MVLTGGTVVSGLLAYVFVAVGTRAVGGAAFAPVSVLWSLWAVTAAAITFPVQHWIIRMVASTGDEEGVWRAAPTIWRLAAVASLVVLVGTYAVSGRLFAVTGWGFPLMAACLPVGSVVMGFNRGLLAARSRFGATALAILGENLFRVLLVVMLADVVTPRGLGWILIAGFAVGLAFPRTLAGRAQTTGQSMSSPSLLGGLAGANTAAQVALTGGPIVLSLLGGTQRSVTQLFAMLAVLRAPHTIAVGVTVRVTGPLTRRATTGDEGGLRRMERWLVWSTIVLVGLSVVLGPVVVPAVTTLVFGVSEALPVAATVMLTAGAVVALSGLVEMLVLVALGRGRQLAYAWGGALVAATATLLLPVVPIARVAAAFLVAETVALSLMLLRDRWTAWPPTRSIERGRDRDGAV